MSSQRTLGLLLDAAAYPTAALRRPLDADDGRRGGRRGTVVLVHGYPTPEGRRQLAAFRGLFPHRVLAFGEPSTAIDGFEWTRRLAAFLAGRLSGADGPVALVGFSLGAVAMHLAAEALPTGAPRPMTYVELAPPWGGVFGARYVPTALAASLEGGSPFLDACRRAAALHAHRTRRLVAAWDAHGTCGLDAAPGAAEEACIPRCGHLALASHPEAVRIASGWARAALVRSGT